MEKAELYYQSVIDGMQDMVFVMRVSNDGQYFYYEYINKKAIEVLGLTTEIVGEELASVNPTHVTSVLYDKYREVVVSEKPLTYQDTFHRYENEQMVSETTLTPLWDNNVINKIVAVTRDITKLKIAEWEREHLEEKMKISRRRYKSLFIHNPEAIFHIGLKGNLIRDNNALEKLTGIKANFIKGISILDIIPEQDKGKVKKAFYQAIQGKPAYFNTVINTYFLKDAFLQVKLAPVILNRSVQGVYAIIKDMTVENKVKQKLIENEEKFRLITEYSYDLIALIDRSADIIYASPSHAYVLGFPTEDFIGKSLLDLVHEDDHSLLRQAIVDSIEDEFAFTIEYRIRDSQNEWYWFELNGQPVFKKNGQFQHMVTVGRDITVRKRYEERLKNYAYHDYLTNLPNRRLFQDHLTKMLALFERNEKAFAVMMLDLDNFKEINDKLGHDVGDEVIKEFGHRLQSTIREMDMVARMGGDEFVILISEVESLQNVKQVVNRIEMSIAKQWNIAGFNFEMSSSIGVVVPSYNQFTVKELIKHADEALYEAKNTGKNRSVITICE
ncbi:hypothetical protein GCM10011351_09640 [Paraliobacillus quinghaiensis]|uniref:Diguanylate cyclase n=1 Tax=Paraliobacillus quinghaiensis TaxID=470815 RepID=A0A917TJX6_9BACI|nr:sensor domain-containing diguanylate cyclase [Paraliobacillus quinghaiensis]GGM26064.1 hypothetical protein GCM10011351_09640 [Paraliobacillus quinghaiensis]